MVMETSAVQSDLKMEARVSRLQLLQTHAIDDVSRTDEKPAGLNDSITPEKDKSPETLELLRFGKPLLSFTPELQGSLSVSLFNWSHSSLFPRFSTLALCLCLSLLPHSGVTSVIPVFLPFFLPLSSPLSHLSLHRLQEAGSSILFVSSSPWTRMASRRMER